MAKGKVTIEMDGGSPTIFEFDDLHVDINREMYSFYEAGKLGAEEIAPNGVMRINIRGVDDKVRKNFKELHAKYFFCERTE